MASLRRTRGSVLVLAPLIVAVVLLGYGAATDSLVVSGMAQTGDVSAVWASQTCDEFHSWPDIPDPLDPGDAALLGEYLGKEVAETTVTGLDSDTLAISTTDGYPSYGVICTFEYENAGSVPIKVDTATVMAVSGLTFCNPSGTATMTLACNELTLMFTPDRNPQCLDRGDSEAVELVYHVEQPAPQQGRMTFRIDLPVIQCEKDDEEEEEEEDETRFPTRTKTPRPEPTERLAPEASPTATPTATRTPTATAVPPTQVPTRAPTATPKPGVSPPISGDGGLIGLVGMEDERPGDGGRLLLAVVVMLVLFSAVVAGLRQTAKNNGERP